MITLISFADQRYQSSLARLQASLEPFPIDRSFFHTEKDLPPAMIRLIQPRLYRRGYGYWRWKPFLVAQAMEKLHEGDVLIYTDCGNFWNPGGTKRFAEYLSMLSEERPVVAFQEPFLEKDWNKGETLRALGVYNEPSVCLSLQLWGGAFFLMKCPRTMQFVKQWQSLNETDGDLFTDRRSRVSNLLGFREHRHDQSVFSVLVKQMPHTEISWQETQDIGCGNPRLESTPIHGKKLIRREQTRWRKLLKALLYPYLRAQGLYLVHVRHFYFARPPKWW